MIKLTDSPTPVPHGPPSSSPTMTSTTVPAASPSGAGGDELPKTGADAVLLVMIAAVLVLVGSAALALLGRQRRGQA